MFRPSFLRLQHPVSSHRPHPPIHPSTLAQPHNMLSTSHRLIVALALVLFVLSHPCRADESMCTTPEKHPAYTTSTLPVLIKCWTYMNTPRLPRTAYLTKYDRHMYAPASDPTSMVYDRLDWFWTASGHGDTNDFVKLHMNRNSRVYMAVPVHHMSKLDGEVSLGDGWKPVGEAILVKGLGEKFKFGVFQTYEPKLHVPERVYIFQKRGRDVQIPHFAWIGNNVRGFEIPNGRSIIFMITEGDGTSWEYPPNPPSVTEPIVPNQKCPDQLHDLWVTANTDDDDEDTAGMVWKTWHPLWDPIYWWYVHSFLLFFLKKCMIALLRKNPNICLSTH